MVGAVQLAPKWLESLAAEKFFLPCFLHESATRSERNILCLDCCTIICYNCVSPHRPHRLLKVRRYIYNEVIRVAEVEKFFDCSLVQAYTTNAAKVLFLKERPHSRRGKSNDKACFCCNRSLQDGNRYCSVACKVKHLVKEGEDFSKHLHDFQFPPFQVGKEESEVEDGLNILDSGLQPSFSHPSGSGAGSSSSGNGDAAGCSATLTCTATTEFVRKKRSSTSAVPRSAFRPSCRAATAEISSTHLRQRKGVPNRSPMY